MRLIRWMHIEREGRGAMVGGFCGLLGEERGIVCLAHKPTNLSYYHDWLALEERETCLTLHSPFHF